MEITGTGTFFCTFHTPVNGTDPVKKHPWMKLKGWELNCNWDKFQKGTVKVQKVKILNSVFLRVKLT